jgi:Skp family chaperone for outer membrane proteins
MGATAPETTTNQEEEDMDLEELSGKVEALSNTVAGLDEKIGTAVADALKPLTDQLTANAEAEKAKAEAEHEKLVNAVVTAELLDEETAKESPAAVLNALIERNKPGQATLLNGAYKPASNKSGSFQLPAGEE